MIYRGKNKILSKFTVILLTIVMLVTSVPLSAFAEEYDPSTQVHVMIKNDTYPDSDDWTGTLVNQWVYAEDGDTIMNCIVKAAEQEGISAEDIVGADTGYIGSVCGLAEFDGGGSSGWQILLNDWFINAGGDQFFFGTDFEPGDEILLAYTLDMGSDLGGTFSNNDKTVKDITFSEGALSPSFSYDTHEYTLTITDANVDEVFVTPTASNKNFQVRTYLGSQTDENEYKRTVKVPIENGSTILVICGDPAWPSMNNQVGGSGADVPAETYTINVVYDIPAVNNAPTVKEGAATTATVEMGKTYSLDLSTIFEDADTDDTLTYKVSVDGVEAVEVTKAYSYTPTAAGTYALKFTASDGEAEAEHTVTLTVNKAIVATTIYQDNGNLKPHASGYVKTIVIDGVNVKSYKQVGDVFYVELDPDTADNAVVTVKPTVQGYVIDSKVSANTPISNSTVTLSGGKAEKVMQIQAVMMQGNRPMGTIGSAWNVTIKFSNTGFVPTLAEGVSETAEADGMVGEEYTVDLSALFTDPTGGELTYSVKVGDGEYTAVSGSSYAVTPDAAGTMVLEFKANNGSTDSDKTYKLTLNVAEAKVNTAPNVKDGAATTATIDLEDTYSVDLSTIFEDADNDTLTYTVSINGAAAVEAAKDYSYTPTSGGEYALKFVASDGKATAEHTVTLTVNGAVVITPTTIYTGAYDLPYRSAEITSIVIDKAQVETYKWIDKYNVYIELDANTPDDGEVLIDMSASSFGSIKVNGADDATITLTNGEAQKTYNTKTSAFNYSWNFNMYFAKAFAPELAEGVSESVDKFTFVNMEYSLDLSEIFTDIFGRELTYFVSVDGGEFTKIEGSTYKLTPTELGEIVLVFKANNGKIDSEKTYTVNLDVIEVTYNDITINVPSDITPTFYETEGYNEDGTDILGDELTATKGTTENGLTAYTVSPDSLVKGISVRGKDAQDKNWGGVVVANVDESTVTLRKVETALTDLADQTVEGTVKVTYDTDKTAVMGEDNYYLLEVGKEYTFVAAPKNTAYYVAKTENKAVEAGTDAQKVTLKLSFNSPKTITAPTGADVGLYLYKQYYSYSDRVKLAVVDNGNGTSTHYFYAPKVSGQPVTADVWRVSMEGKITKTGWWTSNQTVTYSDSDKAPTDRIDYKTSTDNGAIYAEDSVLVNVNAQNHLVLDVDGTYKLKAYRIWEVIPVSYNNWIITPDFHYNILSDNDDVISLTKAESPSTNEGDWMTVTGLKEGTAIIEVSYDAMQVYGGNSDWTGFYGASDPARNGLIVVQVGGTKANVNFGIDSFASQGSVFYNESNAKAWDAEFDTLYFTENNGVMTFAPQTDEEITNVAVSNDKGETWTTLTANDEGKYTANIVTGNNILRVTTDKGVAYQVVRGYKVNVTLTEQEGDGDGFYESGETVRVSFSELHYPIPKMAGNYNPGYRGNTDIPGGDGGIYIKYSLDGENVVGPGTQYNLNSIEYIDVTIPDGVTTDEIVIENGYFGFAVMGLPSFNDGGDSHRNIPDEGCTTRGGSGQTTLHTRSMLPDVTIPVTNNDPNVKADAVSEAEIFLGEDYAVDPNTFFEDVDGDTLTFEVSVNGGNSTPATAEYKITPTAKGTMTLKFVATDGKTSNPAEHTVTLTVKNNAPTVKEGIVSTAEIFLGEDYAVDPSTLFEDKDGDTLTYTVSVNDGTAENATSDYKITPSVKGIAKLVFTATDGEAGVTHTIELNVKNNAPNVKADAITTADTVARQEYALDLSTIFEDKDGDALTYKVAVNDAQAVDAAADYKYTPAKSGTVTLKFVANDGEAEAEHVVTINVSNTTPNVKEDAATTATIKLGEEYTVEPSTFFEDGNGDTLTYTVAVNGGEATVVNGEYKITPTAKGEVTLKFVANDGEAEAEHTVTLTVKDKAIATFKVTPSDAIVKVYNSNGLIVSPNEDGEYIEYFDEVKLTYVVAKKGYVAETGEIPAEGGEIKIDLVAAPESTLKDVDAYWPIFRGTENNMAIVDMKLPTDPEKTELVWNKKIGSGWSDAPSVQIIADDALFTMVNTKIYKLNLETGEVLASGDMIKASNWGYTPAIYADGLIICPIGDAQLQAFNAETLESVWIYKDNFKGQSLTPIAYSDGYIYTGFYGSNNRNFVCIDITDENPAKTNETKLATWKHVVPGGFYWSGAVVVGDYVCYGSEKDAEGNGHLFVTNKYTGEVIEDIAVLGNIRSTVAYDAAEGKVYFTTQSARVYSAEINASTGKISNVKYVQLDDTSSTSTPIVYKGRIYVYSYSGFSGGNFTVVDEDKMEVLFSVSGTGAAQGSPILSTAFEDEGYLCFYNTYNSSPGGIRMVKVATDAKSAEDAQVIDVYDAKGFEQYCITSLICDEEGTIYYKNDSLNIFAVRRVNSAPNVKEGAVTTATIKLGEEYTVEPSTFFEDGNGDTLTYTVAVNGGEATVVNGEYKITPTAKGEVVLKFVANDGEAEAQHTVTLTVENNAPTVKDEATESEKIFADKEIAIDPSTLFEDKDNDNLTYKVSVNGKEAEAIGKDYTFKPEGAGTYELKFTATDGTDTEEHTVTITVKDYYKIISGDNSEWTLESGKDVEIICNGEFDEFVGFKVDGKVIDKANYTAVEGSTIITLKADYLDTLTAGEHDIAFSYEDHDVAGKITVKEAEKGNQGEGGTGSGGNNEDNQGTDTPKTGDNIDVLVYSMILLAVSGISIIAINKRRKQN